MNKKDSNLLNEFSEIRNLTLRTKHGYKNSLNIYTCFQDENFVNLLKEADYEEEKGIRWKNRKLKQRLINFRLFLNDKYMISSAKVHFQRILTLYKHFEIEIHNLPKISIKSSKVSCPINYEDLPSKEIIRGSLKIASPVMKPLILFMCSSGCARRECLNLSILDFIDATYEFHNENNVNDALLKLNNLNNVVPTFRIMRQKTNKFYFTFCSPEASKEIVNYLLEFRNLNPQDKLFKINLDYLNAEFKRINNELNLGKVGNYNRFRSHMLRKFHASSLYNAVDGLSLEEIDALQGRKKDLTRSSYFMENPNVLKEKYMNVMDSVMFF